MTEYEKFLNKVMEPVYQATGTSTILAFNDPFLEPVSNIEVTYYTELSAAGDVFDFMQRIHKIVNDMGFSDYLFIRPVVRVGVDLQLLTSIPNALIANYFKEEFHECDMILQYAESNIRPVYCSTIHDYLSQAPFDFEPTHAMQAIYELHKSFGYYDYYNIPVEAEDGSGNVMLSVTERGCSPIELKRKVQGCESTLQLLCEAIDFVATRKFPTLFRQEWMKEKQYAAINPKPLSVLDALANNDFTISQVADMLCISSVTANKHLESVRKALGTKTNHAAIKKAMLAGLIEYEE